MKLYSEPCFVLDVEDKNFAAADETKEYTTFWAFVDGRQYHVSTFNPVVADLVKSCDPKKKYTLVFRKFYNKTSKKDVFQLIDLVEAQ